MSQTYDLILKGGTVVNHDGRHVKDVGIKNGKIAYIGDLTGAGAVDVYDVTGLHVLPGVIDTQVHFREPGNEHKEDLESGTRAAVMGGVTGIFEMPNTNPMTTTAEAINDKIDRATGRAWCDFAFYVGATRENAEQLPELERLPGVSGVKIFMGSSTGNLLVEDDESLLKVLQNGTRRVAVHCEDEDRLNERKDVRKEDTPHSHPEWRDATTALKATQRIVKLAREAGRRVHVLHITTADEMEFLKDHKDVVSVETTPQHLTLSAPKAYDELGTYAQMNPPIRSEEHRLGCWHGVEQGVVDVIGSDHAPHTHEEKAQSYPASPSGMPGVQTLVPVMLDHVNKGNITLERFVDLTSAGACRLFNLSGKGRIAAGYDADFTIVDLNEERTIDNSWIESKCGWTPFHGKTVKGWPKATIIRGEIVMKDDVRLSDPIGKPIRFLETM